MLFNSFEFLLFLPLVFILYWIVFKKLKNRNILLLIASYLFYGWWDYRFLCLIIGITVISWYCGMLLKKHEHKKRTNLGVLWFMITVSLGCLFLFKYFNFFSTEFCRILNYVGLQSDSITLDLVLPVGISFYTFQALSYVIDVYRGDIKSVSKPLPYFVFISFFPQLVAGPIERASNLIPQFEKNREFRYNEGCSGMKLILWGLFKKVIIADNASAGVNIIFADFTEVGTLNLWIGALLFTFQIYGDFSGYSDMAVGTARLFGIKLMRNFNMPYFSRNIADFWRRWHISLTSWFRDYVYIPLGGNRCGKAKTVRNTMIVFITSGLWHGANLTFIVWGLYHAILFLPNVIMGKRKVKLSTELNENSKLNFAGTVLLIGVTFFLVMIGWIIFRADNLTHAIQYISLMFSRYTPVEFIIGKISLLWIALFIIMEWVGKDKETPLSLCGHGVFKFKTMRWLFYVSVYLVCLIFGGAQSDFIYFQF